MYRGNKILYTRKETDKVSFREYLYAELINDGIIDEDSVDPEDLSEEMLLTETELEEADIENYKESFRERCQHEGETPDWDLED